MANDDPANLHAEIASLQDRLVREREAREQAPVTAISAALDSPALTAVIDSLQENQPSLTGERGQAAQDLLSALQIARSYFALQNAMLQDRLAS